MNLWKFINRVALVAAVLAAMVPFAVAQSHPHYAEARNKLVRAGMLLQAGDPNPNVASQMRYAHEQVTKAIADIDKAVKLDNSQMEANPSVNNSLKGAARLNEIRDLLTTSRTALEQAETNATAAQWRKDAMKEVDDAIRSVTKATSDMSSAPANKK